jgi:exopolysaccharide production protein ExoY
MLLVYSRSPFNRDRMPPRKTPVEPVRKTPPRVRSGEFPGGTANTAKWPDVPETESRRVVIVGAPDDIPRALQHPAAIAGRFEVVAALAVDVESDDQDGGVTALATLLGVTHAETILVAGPVGAGTMRRVADLALLHHCELLAVMPTEVLAGHDPVIVWSGESPLVQLARIPRRPWEIQVKRAFDIIGSAIGLVIAAPFFALLAIAIRLESRGSVLFRHERVGRAGRKFQCLKLRTMSADAEAVLRADAEMYEEYRRNHYKIPDDLDPRVTTVGRFVRRTSLDELPQLWNVLVGEMSLVGPRPVVEDELEHYGTARDLLLSVRPGITGAWAVSGRHGVGYPERCNIELAYVRRWTLYSDVSALAGTVGAVLKPGG